MGTTLELTPPNAGQFRSLIRPYVDSQFARWSHLNATVLQAGNDLTAIHAEQGGLSSSIDSTAHQLVLWPLVRQVKIWCNSDVLSSGAVLVRL